MNLIRRVSAIYKEQELPEYRGNPLIEALPEALTEDEVLLEMSYFPEIDEKIRWTAPANVREQYVERIKKFRCPQTNLIQAYKMILRALRESYAARNPLKAEQFNIFITMEMSVLILSQKVDILNPRLKLLR